MDFRLSDGRQIVLDNKAVPDDRADAIRWLKERSENGVKERDLNDYSEQELYDFKDRLKARRIAGRGPDQNQARLYKRTMLKRINAELRRRKLPATRPDDGRCYGPGCAKWQNAGAAK